MPWGTSLEGSRQAMIACLILLVLVGGALGVPIGLGVAIYENAGGGPYSRSVRRANRKAERAYVRSLSPEDREAYEFHKKRKMAYRRLGPFEPYKPGEWDDVVKAIDYPDGNLSLENTWGPPNNWSPPKTEKSEHARWLKAAREFVEGWGKDYKDAHLNGGKYGDGGNRWDSLRRRHMDDRRGDFDYSLLNAYCPTGVVDITDDGDGKGWCVCQPKSFLDGPGSMVDVKRWMLTVRAYKDGVPVMLEMMVGVSKDRGDVCVVQVASESGRDETLEERKDRMEREDQEGRERQRLDDRDAERRRLALRDSRPMNY